MPRAQIENRLSAYWKLEAANAVIIPAVYFYFAHVFGWTYGFATITTLITVCMLLVIGAEYWRAKLSQLRHATAFPRSIGLLAKLQWPSAGLAAVAAMLAVCAWLLPGFAVSEADRWSASAFALLTVLEYVNYYHRQLQHFDHLPDWKRLMSGRGFRRSQMARDIARWPALK